MSKSYRLAEIAKWIGGVVRGDATTRISGVSSIEEANSTQITWLAQAKYADQLQVSRAGAVLVPSRYGETPMPAVLCENPSLAIITLLERFAPPVPRPEPGVDRTASIAETAVLGRDVAVGAQVVIGSGTKVGDRSIVHANAYIGSDVEVGKDCEIWPGVVIRERCRLGDRVVIHPNTTIGADGYGYQFVDGRHMKVPQIGVVEIEDDVEIGSNCCVDRAKFGVTRVGAGTKIDNLVQVAHNVKIGRNCLIVAQCGIAGSTCLGEGVVLGGKVGISDHVTVGDGVRAAACCGISKDVLPGKTLFGIPAVEMSEFVRERGKLRRLPGMAEQLKALIKRVEQLEAAADNS